MTTRSRRDTGEINALGSARRGEDTPQQNGRDPEKIELHAQRGRSPARDTGLESNRLPSPRLRLRASSCPPIPQRSGTVVRFPQELAAMATTRGPAGPTRKLTPEDSIEAAMPPRQERYLRKRPAPPPEGTDTTVAPSGSSAVHGVATRASKRRRLDSTPGTPCELPSRCPPSPSLSSLSSLSLSTLTPPPSDSQLPEEKTCSNCRTTVAPYWPVSTLKPGCTLCLPCAHYERRHHESRPLELEMKLSQRGVKKCGNCGETTSVRWDFSKLNPGRKLCHKCGLYEMRSGKVRPPALFQRSQIDVPKTSSSRLRRSRRNG
ncbi:hypothetical protein DFH06DRAFT_690630 [Mycena polygramma]|nr:hypothetical protein DFH06DRAFT_690630 [Mycena polygramma]